jgi:flagellar biosynthesis/type III secretory pathway M-ring protein FliF/YscJ
MEKIKTMWSELKPQFKIFLIAAAVVIVIALIF